LLDHCAAKFLDQFGVITVDSSNYGCHDIGRTVVEKLFNIEIKSQCSVISSEANWFAKWEIPSADQSFREFRAACAEINGFGSSIVRRGSWIWLMMDCMKVNQIGVLE